MEDILELQLDASVLRVVRIKLVVDGILNLNYTSVNKELTL